MYNFDHALRVSTLRRKHFLSRAKHYLHMQSHFWDACKEDFARGNMTADYEQYRSYFNLLAGMRRENTALWARAIRECYVGEFARHGE